MRTLLLLLLVAPLAAAQDPDPLAARQAEEAKALAVFDQPDALVIYSIEPRHYADWGYGRIGAPHRASLAHLREGVSVHGQLTLEAAPARQQLGAALRGAYTHRRGERIPRARCYAPRHALVARRGKAIAVAHICFQCNYMVLLVEGSPRGNRLHVMTGFQPLRKAIEAPLAKAGVYTDGRGPRPADGARPLSADEQARHPLGREAAEWQRQATTVTLLRLAPDGGWLDAPDKAIARVRAGDGVLARRALTLDAARQRTAAGLLRGLLGGAPAAGLQPAYGVLLEQGERAALWLLAADGSAAAVIGVGEAGRAPRAYRDDARLRPLLERLLTGARDGVSD